MASLYEELKRRNVIRVVVLYIVVGWLLMQVADVLFPAMELPNWTIRLVFAMLAIGFPAAIIFSWAFEITPEGVKREKDIDRSKSVARFTGRKLDYITIGVVVAAVGFAVVDRMTRSPEMPAPEIAVVTEAPEPVETAPDRPESSKTSVAVLPFVNMSNDPDNEFFSDGISEELLNVLVKVQGLRVPSRTSSFAFKGKDVSISDIARELGVDHILEGSVRKAGNTVRVTAQLIDVKTDTHLWSETYDRELEDIFAIQDEIAQNIVSALEATLGTAPAGLTVGRQPTENLEAYQLYLQGRHLWLQRGIENISEGIRLLEQAVELDPEFAQAWAALGAARITLPYYALTPRAENDRLAGQAARRALELDETLGEAWATVASEGAWKGDWVGSLELWRKAAEIAPNDSTLRLWYGIHLMDAGYLERALSQFELAVRLDPVSAVNNDWLARTYAALGRYSEAEAGYERAISLGRRQAAGSVVELLRATGREAEVREYVYARPDIFGEAYLTLFELISAAMSDPAMKPQAMEYLAELPFVSPTAYKMDSYIQLGEYDLALQNIRRIAEFDDTVFTLFWNPLLAHLRQHPDFPELMREAGFVELWEKEGYPDMCRAVGDSFECD